MGSIEPSSLVLIFILRFTHEDDSRLIEYLALNAPHKNFDVRRGNELYKRIQAEEASGIFITVLTFLTYPPSGLGFKSHLAFMARTIC